MSCHISIHTQFGGDLVRVHDNAQVGALGFDGAGQTGFAAAVHAADDGIDLHGFCPLSGFRFYEESVPKSGAIRLASTHFHSGFRSSPSGASQSVKGSFLSRWISVSSSILSRATAIP